MLFFGFQVGVLSGSSSVCEDIEEGFSFNSLDDGSGLVGLFVLLLLLDLLFGWVLTLSPCNEGAFSLLDIIVITLVDDFQCEELLIEELVLVEVEVGLESLDRFSGSLCVNMLQVLEDLFVLFLDQIPDHLVVLDSLEPEVRNTADSLQVINFDWLIFFIFFLFLIIFSLSRDQSALFFKLFVGLIEGDFVSCEVSNLTGNDLASCFI